MMHQKNVFWAFWGMFGQFWVFGAAQRSSVSKIGLLSLILKSLLKSRMRKAPVSDFCIVTAGLGLRWIVLLWSF